MEIELKDEIIIGSVNDFAKRVVYKITKGEKQIFVTPDEIGVVLREGIGYWKEMQDIGDNSEYLFNKVLLVENKAYLAFTIYFAELTASMENEARDKLLEAARKFDEKIK